MPGYRLERINDDIKQELADLLPTLKDPRVRGMISITRVDVTADLRYCKVYVSVLERDRLEDVIRGLRSAGGYLRRELGRRVRLRYTPELLFVPDDSIVRGAKLIQLMDELNQPEQGEKKE